MWQPIETAPKDGTPVLVKFKSGGYRVLYYKEGAVFPWLELDGSRQAMTSALECWTEFTPPISPIETDSRVQCAGCMKWVIGPCNVEPSALCPMRGTSVIDTKQEPPK